MTSSYSHTLRQDPDSKNPPGLHLHGQEPFGQDFETKQHHLSVLNNYGIAAAFAVSVTTLILNIYCYCRVKYGRQQRITHLSLQPYQISMLFILLLMVELIYYLVQIDVIYGGNVDAFVDVFLNSSHAHWYFFISAALHLAKNIFLFIFMTMRTNHFDILFIFILFQSANDLSTLHVRKDKYNQIEKRLYHNMQVRCWLVIGLFVTIMVGCLIDIEIVADITFVVGLGAEFMIYMWHANHHIWSGYHLLRLMYFNHRYEFYRHVKRGTILFLFTWISLTILLL